MWVKKIKYCKLNIHKASHLLIFEGTYSRSTTYGSAIMISIMYFPRHSVSQHLINDKKA